MLSFDRKALRSCSPHSGSQCQRLCRTVRTVRQACLDQLIMLNEIHLRNVMREFVTHYNTARPHQGIQPQLPVPPLSRPPAVPFNDVTDSAAASMNTSARLPEAYFALWMYFSCLTR